ncbi:MAG: FAD-dependent oxidoreductase, partial [Cyanobacteria bacterium REEB67]|nr:FAD-dependent oxidoreductase [Cyanobacteria bacterium REEB67]
EIKKVTRIAIIGGGFIGLELAEQFSRRNFHVTVVDAQEQVLAQLDPGMAEFVHKELVDHNVKLILGAPLVAIKSPNEIETKDIQPMCGWVVAGTEAPFAADMVILGLGVRPETALARKAGLEIGTLGGIRVNEYLQSSQPHIWAVGDAIEVKHPVSNAWALIPLGGPANRQGRMAADNIFGKQQTYGGTLGTAVLRVFDLTVALVGLNESKLKAANIPFQTVNIHPSNHAGYYPGAERIDLRLSFAPETGRILGAQAIGKSGVDKRIDIIATAMKGGMTVRDLAQLELAYAPPFGSAKDPINLIGMAASDLLDGLVEQIQAEDLEHLPNNIVVDVRSEKERQGGFIPGSIHLPLPELRKKLSELPTDKDIVVSCQSGQRSYFAARLLRLKGFSVKNLSGGYLTWAHRSGVKSALPAHEGSSVKGQVQ